MRTTTLFRTEILPVNRYETWIPGSTQFNNYVESKVKLTPIINGKKKIFLIPYEELHGFSKDGFLRLCSNPENYLLGLLKGIIKGNIALPPELKEKGLVALTEEYIWKDEYGIDSFVGVEHIAGNLYSIGFITNSPSDLEGMLFLAEEN